MTNTERRNKFNAISAHFTVGALVGINTTDGTEDGTVDFVGWDHYMDAPFVAVRVLSARFGYTIVRMSVANVYRAA